MRIELQENLHYYPHNSDNYTKTDIAPRAFKFLKSLQMRQAASVMILINYSHCSQINRWASSFQVAVKTVIREVHSVADSDGSRSCSNIE